MIKVKGNTTRHKKLNKGNNERKMFNGLKNKNKRVKCERVVKKEQEDIILRDMIVQKYIE